MSESSFVRVDGLPVHYGRSGTGPPVILLHGLAADGGMWESNLAALTPQRTAFALDLPNMGKTARNARMPARLGETAAWLGRVLDALGLGVVDLVGSSHGGAICLMFAAASPTRVRSMVLFSPANPFCRRPAALLKFWNSPVGALVAALIPLAPRWLKDAAHRRVYADPRVAPESVLVGYRLALGQQSVAHLRRLVSTWWEDMDELESVLPKASAVRALLIWGDRDEVVGLDSGQRLASVLGARLVVLASAGHLPSVERSDEANSELSHWFTLL